jgi:CubicO group peptidase (beta-lactamase class C family)
MGIIAEARMARAEAAGLRPDRVTRLLERARREVDDGLLPAVQVAVARHGQLALCESFGAEPEGVVPGADRAVPLICVFSATKAVTAAAAWLLFQEGRLDEQHRVADLIPEFGSNGKDAVTVQQLFTHTAGFPHAPFRPLDWLDPQRRRERFQQWRLTWEPGSRYEYHPTASMWVIAELIERCTGQDFREFIRTRVLHPLGLDDLYVGLPADQNYRVLPCLPVGAALTAADYAALGLQEPPQTEVTEDAILNFNRPEVRAVGVPGGGGIMSAAALALFYQGLLNGGLNDVEIWTRETLHSARRIRTGSLVDPLYGRLANRGLGIIIAGDDDRHIRGFGRGNSAEAFGHNGAGGQLAWVDPASGLSLAYLTNGHDRNGLRQARRGVAIGSLAAVLCDP